MTALLFRAQHRHRASQDTRKAQQNMEYNNREKYRRGRRYLNSGHVGHIPNPDLFRFVDRASCADRLSSRFVLAVYFY